MTKQVFVFGLFLLVVFFTVSGCSARRQVAKAAMPSSTYPVAFADCVSKMLETAKLSPEKSGELCSTVLSKTMEAATAAANAAAKGGWNPPIIAYPGGWYGPGVYSSGAPPQIVVTGGGGYWGGH